MRAAVIDIGSNSVKLVIGEGVDEEVKVLETLKNVIEIGKSTFYKGRISQNIFNQIIDILLKYKKTIDQYEISDVKVIATTAVREAENRDIFLDTIRRKTGFTIEIFNVGDVVYFIDSFLSYKLKKTAYPIYEKNLLIAELGAGSLDASFMEKGFTLTNLGVPIGTFRLKQFKNRIEGSQKETYEALDEYVDNEMYTLKRTIAQDKIDDIILIDESYSSALQQILPNESRTTNFFKFSHKESEEFLKAVTRGNLDDLAHKFKLSDDIADSIDGYALILNKLFRLTKSRSIYILETSLSEALLGNMIYGVEISKKYNKTNQLLSVAKFLCRKFDANLKHAKHIADLCEQLFGHLKELLGLNDEDLLYLKLAAYLHNIGVYVNNRAHHKHSEYIINSQSLFRLTDQEIKMIACIARYHRKAVPQKTHVLYSSLPPRDRIMVQKLSAILRLANSLDSSHKQKVKKLEIKINRNQEITLVVYVQDSFVLEKMNFLSMRTLFEEISGNKINLIIKRQS